jgi:hypothetical protein
LPHISVDIRGILIRENGSLIRRHLTLRVPKLEQEALERELRSREPRPGRLCPLACKTVTLITAHLLIERLAMVAIACRRRRQLGGGRADGKSEPGESEYDVLHGFFLNAAA